MDNIEFPPRVNHHCPLCQARMISTSIDVVREDKDKILIYSNCQNCGVGLVAKLSMVPQGLVGVGILTDVKREEIEKLGTQEPVTAEDVLDMKVMVDKGVIKIND